MDYQASTPIDPRVAEAMAPYWSAYWGNPHSTSHSFGWEAQKHLENATQQIAACINVDPDEIIFTSGATESNNMALLGLAAKAQNKKRNRVLISSVEHKCVLTSARIAAERFGFKVELIEVNQNGEVDLDTLAKKLDEDVLLVSVIAVNNEIGSINKLSEIASLCHSVGALFHTDATHYPTHTRLDVEALDIDLVSLSAHKLYGPKGIGALVIRRTVQPLVEPLIYGGGQQNGLRSGTVPVPLCVGFAAAIKELSTPDIDNEFSRIRALRDKFVKAILESGNNSLNGPPLLNRHPGNANILFPGKSAEDILSALQPQLAASTGSACTSGMPEPSHVLLGIGLDREKARSSIRFSIGRFTTEKDIIEAIGIVRLTRPAA